MKENPYLWACAAFMVGMMVGGILIGEFAHRGNVATESPRVIEETTTIAKPARTIQLPAGYTLIKMNINYPDGTLEAVFANPAVDLKAFVPVVMDDGLRELAEPLKVETEKWLLR